MPEPISYPEFEARCLALYSTGKHARKTLGRVRQVLRELGQLGAATTADLTTATMARYVASRGPTANPNTTNGLLSTAAALCSYAVEEGWLARPPAWRRVRPRARPMTLNAPRPRADVARLLAHLHGRRGDSWQAHRLCALAWTIALTGLRLGEATHLHRDDLDLARRRLVVDPARSRLKTEASAREVPIPDRLADVLGDWIARAQSEWVFPGVKRRGPWTGGNPADRPLGHLKRAAASIGLARITWHSLRHSFGTAAFEAWGLAPWVVQQVLGHTDLRTTMRYVHLARSPEIARAMAPIAY